MTPDPASDPALARTRLAATAALASLAVHSGRSRLAAVRTALELLQARMEGDLSDEQRSSFLGQLDLFLNEFNLGAELLRCHQGEIEAVGVRGAAGEAMEQMRPGAARAGVALDFQDQGAPEKVRADAGLLRVALLNLLRNALEALQDGPPERPRIVVRVAAAGTRARIEVEDNGPGVAPALREKLFRDYVTDRPGKPGVGLSICRDALAVMGGTVAHALPASGRGALFRLELDSWAG
ncbi:MAG TPA: sensor histidine kinase [Opitutaceae bacterium]|nr:sensor histidine kinase [Opitutaceae bacterium]